MLRILYQLTSGTENIPVHLFLRFSVILTGNYFKDQRRGS